MFLLSSRRFHEAFFLKTFLHCMHPGDSIFLEPRWRKIDMLKYGHFVISKHIGLRSNDFNLRLVCLTCMSTQATAAKINAPGREAALANKMYMKEHVLELKQLRLIQAYFAFHEKNASGDEEPNNINTCSDRISRDNAIDIGFLLQLTEILFGDILSADSSNHEPGFREVAAVGAEQFQSKKTLHHSFEMSAAVVGLSDVTR
ncbi:hypothetical protein VNO77_23239 [Canavalia gladiata]|uniref:Uncharacterized protein n=1 Tax=Canavalia gladiata TaxID=3824 RepID=A0AAN9L9B5_CANGL